MSKESQGKKKRTISFCPRKVIGERKGTERSKKSPSLLNRGQEGKGSWGFKRSH